MVRTVFIIPLTFRTEPEIQVFIIKFCPATNSTAVSWHTCILLCLPPVIPAPADILWRNPPVIPCGKEKYKEIGKRNYYCNSNAYILCCINCISMNKQPYSIIKTAYNLVHKKNPVKDCKPLYFYKTAYPRLLLRMQRTLTSKYTGSLNSILPGALVRDII